MASRGVNKVILVGRLGDAPEVRYMPNGKAVANLSLATSESWKNQQGEVQELTEWHRLTMYGRLGEIAGEYLAKGAQIYVEGKLRTRKWQDQQGQDRYTTEIIVDNMQMLGGRSGAQSNPPAQQSSNPNLNPDGTPRTPAQMDSQNNRRRGTTAPPMAEPDFDFDDDIPFAPLFKQHRSMNYAC